MTEAHQISGSPLTAHSFNGDRTQVAISCNSPDVKIFTQTSNGDWTAQATLAEHDKLVTSIDWAPKTNRIVTCSHDRNAYVWNLEQDAKTGATSWQPTLVLLRLNRSATCVRWSPNEDKFAVASGARAIAVCQFDEESNWWVSKHLKRPLRSSVLGLDWHPNSVLLASGSADGKARVFSAFIKGIDAKPAPSVWGEKLPFNTVCGEFDSPYGGWVHDVAFSPSGDCLAFASHDSSVTVVYPSGPEQAPQALYRIEPVGLPFVTLTFVGEGALVAAGHSCQPIMLEGTVGEGWAETRSLDEPDKRKAGGGGSGTSTPGLVGRLNNSQAFQAFRAADSKGVAAGAAASGGGASAAIASAVAGGARLTSSGTELLTTHQNTITSVRAFAGTADAVSAISTTGVDGKLVLWQVDDVAAGVQRMALR